MASRATLLLTSLRRDAAPLTLALVVILVSLSWLVDARDAIVATLLFAVVQAIARVERPPANGGINPWLALAAGAAIWVIGFGIVVPRV